MSFEIEEHKKITHALSRHHIHTHTITERPNKKNSLKQLPFLRPFEFTNFLIDSHNRMFIVLHSLQLNEINIFRQQIDFNRMMMKWKTICYFQLRRSIPALHIHKVHFECYSQTFGLFHLLFVREKSSLCILHFSRSASFPLFSFFSYPPSFSIAYHAVSFYLLSLQRQMIGLNVRLMNLYYFEYKEQIHLFN